MCNLTILHLNCFDVYHILPSRNYRRDKLDDAIFLQPLIVILVTIEILVFALEEVGKLDTVLHSNRT